MKLPTKIDSSKPKSDGPEPPQAIRYDGGIRAWLQCLGSFFLLLNSFGLTNSYGAFQTYYIEDLLRDRSESDIAWIGSFQSFLLIAMGIIAGPVYDRGKLQFLVVTGSVLVVVGTILTGICSQYWQFFLAQGLVVGIGAGLLFLPSIAILSQYFKKRLAFATGIGSSGSAVASVCYPIMLQKLRLQIGFRYAVWCIALIMLLTLIVASTVLRFRLKPGAKRRFFEATAWREPPFTLWATYLFISLLGLYLPSFYIQQFGMQFMSITQASYLLPTLNAGSFFGRLIPLFVADLTGPLNMEAPLTLGAAILAFAWIAVKSTGGAFAFSAIYGFFAGAITTVTAPVDVAMCPSDEVVGVRLGMLLFPWALGLLVGTPIGGAILGSERSWLGLQAFTGSVLIVATGLVIVTRASKYGTTLCIRC